MKFTALTGLSYSLTLKQLSFDPKRNSLGFLRLVLALAVIYAHGFELGGFGNDFMYQLSGNLYSIGALAVDGFFALSGYLITASYVRLASLPRFLWHRILRLFPAYWVCLVIVGVVFVPLLGLSPNFGYIWHNLLNPVRSVCLGIVGLVVPLLLGWAPNLEHIQDKLWLNGQSVIEPLFANNPFPNAVNGSLWTLDAEVRCYIIIALLGLVGLLRKNFISGLLLLVWVAYIIYFQGHRDLSVVSSLRLPAHFLAGAAFYFWKPPLNPIVALCALVVALIAFIGGFYYLVSPLTTVYVLFWLAAVLPFKGIGRKRDYSYGLYIYGFPVQQALSAYSCYRWGFPVYLLLSITFTLALAAASWHLIEKPALGWKDAWSKKPNYA